MPGLYGFLRAPDSTEAATENALKATAQALCGHPRHAALPPFHDARVAAGLVLRRADGAGTQWAQSVDPGAVRVWVDGEAYGDTAPLPTEEFAAALAASFTAGREPPPSLWNGAWAAVVYDPSHHQIQFVTDPYGLRHLYVRTGKAPSWCGSLPGLCALPGAPLVLRPNAVGEFLARGYLLGDDTWFEDVRLVPPGTILRYDLGSKAWSEQRYFAFEDQHPAARPPAYRTAVRELGTLFRAAVVRRAATPSAPSTRIGLTLSGGLDSRALLAALPAEHTAPEALTFGRSGCADEFLAAAACRVRGAHHTFTNLGEEGWLAARESQVALTNGQINILDLHGLESLPQIEERMEICLNGFLGDALLGGSYLQGEGFPFLERYRHRGRRFILQALHYGGTSLEYRLPFMDTALLRYTLALPRDWLRHSRIYKAMLLREFPEYFRTIPWENTGLPISTSPLRTFWTRALKRARRSWNRLQGRSSPAGGYADYRAWLLQDTAFAFLRDRLEAPDALLPRFVPAAHVRARLQRLKDGADESEMLGRMLTLEIWLRSLQRAGLDFGPDIS